MAFQELDQDEDILLITPSGTLPPYESSHRITDSHAETQDPFQRLAAAMGVHHDRIRHVSYQYWVGMTNQLHRMMDHISSVVVVVCEPATTKSPDHIHDMMESQWRFVRQAQAEYDEINEGTEPSAFAVYYFGRGQVEVPEGVPLCLHCPPYNAARLSSVAGDLLQRD